VSKLSKAPKLIDLFCGCGGMSLGAARAGFKVVAGIDRDERALRAHTSNFPKSKHLCLDLSKATANEILQQSGLTACEVDVITGGPPCQGFSTMGKRDVEDTRNQLLSHFFRIVDELKPRAFVLENVPGILNEQYATILADAISIVGESYDVLKPHTLTAFELGAPTLRRRVFIVGFLNTTPHFVGDFWSKPKKSQRAPIVRHALCGLPADINPEWKNSGDGSRLVRVVRSGRFFASATGRVPAGVGNPESLASYQKSRVVTGCWGTKHSADLTSRYAALGAGKSDSKTKSMRLDPDGYCPTLRAGTGPDRGSFQAVRPIHHIRPRVITPREAARLQGFPDWYQFDVTKWHSFRQIGNSVSPIVAEHVMKRVRRALDHE